MKKLKIIFVVVLIASFSACSTKKTEESSSDTAVEADAKEPLGADAEVLENMNVIKIFRLTEDNDVEYRYCGVPSTQDQPPDFLPLDEEPPQTQGSS